MKYLYKCSSCDVITELTRSGDDWCKDWVCGCGNPNDGKRTKIVENILGIGGKLMKGKYNSLDKD